MATSHDVVIVGAGPAGSLAALSLARAGRRVALLDRAAFPRPKVCGNCINPSAWKIWERLALTDSFSRLPHQELAGFTLHSEGRLLYRHTFRPPRRGPRAVSRAVLDDWLRKEAENAGAEFYPETTVNGIDPVQGKVETSRGAFSGRLVFGADGRNSLVARLCGLMPPPQRCHRVAWQATIAAPAGLDDHVHMHLFEEGYFGFCRFSSTEAVVSMVLDLRQTQDPARLARRYCPGLPELEGLRMNPITRPAAQLGLERVWLVGDSARVVEPFTGEGISFAFSTALLAAEAAKRRGTDWPATIYRPPFASMRGITDGFIDAAPGSTRWRAGFSLRRTGRCGCCARCGPLRQLFRFFPTASMLRDKGDGHRPPLQGTKKRSGEPDRFLKNPVREN
jgi:menaquinone-9 beta-reductase